MSDSPSTLVPMLDLSAHINAGEKGRETRLAKMREVEDEVLQRALGNLNAIQSFSEISPDEENPPESWVQEYGLEAATKRLALAKAGWRPMKDAPFGAVQSLQIAVGYAKARGQQVNLAAGELNVKISLPAPTTAEHPGEVVYEVREIE